MKIGCIGAGKHALTNILPAINDLEILKLDGVYCRNSKKSSLIAKHYKCQKYLTIKNLCNNKNLNAIYISSPSSLHFKHAMQVLKSNKHVLVEKPLCLNISQANQLISLAKKNNLVLMEAFMYRFHKQFKTLEKIILKKRLSKIRKTVSVFGIPKLDRFNIRYNKKLGGGSLNDLGVYPLSLVSFLLKDEISKVKYINFKENNNKVDTYGKVNAFLKKNNGQVDFEWYIGGNYKNIIKIIYDDCVIKSKFIFSKKADLITEIVITKKNTVNKIKVDKDNHFLEMLKYFTLTISKRERRILEYKNILKQINTLVTIKNYV
jgi:NDP-hexose-3-ketoreductase